MKKRKFSKKQEFEAEIRNRLTMPLTNSRIMARRSSMVTTSCFSLHKLVMALSTKARSPSSCMVSLTVRKLVLEIR